jgi:ribosomal-protein-serine acetyltransferase
MPGHLSQEIIDEAIAKMSFDNYSFKLITLNDVDAYYDLIARNRARLEQFFAGTVALTQTPESTQKHLEDITTKQNKQHYFSFLIIDTTINSLIGSIQIKSIDWSIPKAEIGYYIDQKYEGKGITSKATAKVIQFGFDILKLSKIYIRTSAENKASIRIAEKNGFSLEGVIRRDYKTTDGTVTDLMYYGCLPEEFKS